MEEKQEGRQQAGNWAERVSLPRGHLEKFLFLGDYEPEKYEQKAYASEKAESQEKQAEWEGLAYANWD